MKSITKILSVTVLFLMLGVQAKATTIYSTPYFQGWEDGTAEWYSKYDFKYPGLDPILIVDDPLPYSGDWSQKVIRVDAATNYLSPLIVVAPGESYAVSAWINWESGGWPFVGISRYNEFESPIGLPLSNEPGTAPRLIWLIGMDGYYSREGYDPPGSLVDPVPIIYGWRWYEKEFTVPTGTAYVRIMTELFKHAGREGDPLAYFDDIAMYSVPVIFFVEPLTPVDEATIESSTVEIATKIIECPSLTDVTFNWTGTDYTLYDSSLVLMFNFDNVRALGEDYEGANAEAGDLVADVSGYDNHGYLSDMSDPDKVPTWTKYGKHGGAFDFTGNGSTQGQSILVDHSESLNPGAGDFAIAFWILTRDEVGGDVLAKGSDPGTTTWYKVKHAPAGTPAVSNKISLDFQTTAGNVTVISSQAYSDNQWHFVVAQRREDQAELWIDGAPDGTAPVTGSISNTANLAIGSNDTQDDDFLNSALDEVRIYKKSFTAAQIQQLYYSNLSKYDLDKWLLYVNQSNLTDGTYTYQASATKATETLLTTGPPRSVTITLPDVPKKGLYLQNVTQDSIVIMWETDTTTGSRVDYGIAAPDEYFVEDATEVTIHEVQLTGLTPNTTYYYTVTWGESTSVTSTFTTAPATPRSFRFVVYGDSRDFPADHTAVVQGIINSEPEFVLHTGDLVSDGMTKSLWGTEFFTPARDLMINTPLYPVLGDNENNASWFYDFLSLPDNGSTTDPERWHAFTYGNVRFIGLDTNVNYSSGSDQYNWLEAELQSSEYKSADWHIVYFHHPPYTAGSEYSDDEDVQTHLVPLFEQYGVDMVLNGHTHAYERYFDNGIYYIVTGGGGADLDTLLTDEVVPIRQLGESVHHHCVIDVGVPAKTLTLRARYNHGEEFDTITLSKRPATIAFMSDPRPQNTNQTALTDDFSQVDDQMDAGWSMDCIQSIGDMDYISESPKNTVDALAASDVCNVPILYCIGNHELDNTHDLSAVKNAFASYHFNPTPGPAGTEETTYYYEVSDMLIVVINEYWDGNDNGRCDWTVPSGGVDADDSCFKYSGTDGGYIPDELFDWLKNVLRGSDRPYKLVVGHEPAYPLIRHVLDSLDQDIPNRDKFWNLLRTERVIAYMTAHDHKYHLEEHNGVFEADSGVSGGMVGGSNDNFATIIYANVDGSGNFELKAVHESGGNWNNPDVIRKTRADIENQTLVNTWEGAGTASRYFVDYTDADQPMNPDWSGYNNSQWWLAEFDDIAAGWSDGELCVGVATNPGAWGWINTQVANQSGVHGVFQRINFTVHNKDLYNAMVLGVDYDDAIIVWLNDQEIYRSDNAPTLEEGIWDKSASSAQDSGGDQQLAPVYTYIDVAGFLSYLNQGNNVLAIGNWNDEASSDDLVAAVELVLDKEFPPLVRAGSTWKYDDTDTDLHSEGWPSVDDSGWDSEPAPLGYGDPHIVTSLTMGTPRYPCYYFRHSFYVEDPSVYESLTVKVLRDDGCVVYLNGTEVVRSNMPSGEITYDTEASTTVGGTDETTYFEYTINPAPLQTGDNVLAVDVHQCNDGSSDLGFDLELSGVLVDLHKPHQPVLVAPADGATGVSTSPTLEVTVSDPQEDSLDVTFYGRQVGAPTYDEIATNTDVSSGSNTATLWAGLSPSTNYEWYVEVTDTSENTQVGPVWSFTTIVTPPGQASSPSPADGVAGVSIDADLSWTAGAGAESHDVYFGIDSTPDEGEFKGNQTETTFNPGTMGSNTTYYWRIDEKNTAGTTTGIVWSFTTAPLPGQASSPSPADGVTGVSIDADLNWTAGSDTTSHDVYFGTNPTPDPGEFQGNQAGTTFDPGTMDFKTTYYWRIDEVGPGGVTPGDVWAFTTEGALPWSDGFESKDFATGGWTTSGTTNVSTKAKYTDDYGAELKGSAWIEKAISTAGFTDIHVKYARKTNGMDDGEFLAVEWYDGSNWHELESTQASSWASLDKTCGVGADDNPNFQIRFITNADKNNEYAYIDDVEITGTPSESTAMGMSTARTMHVDSIVVSFIELKQSLKKGLAEVVILDNNGRAVSGATVTANFSEDIDETVSAVTDGNGLAALETTVTASGRCHLTVTIVSVDHNPLIYEPRENIETTDNNREDD